MEIIHQPESHHFVAEVGGAHAVLIYKRAGNSLDLVSTHVPLECRGKGVADLLVRAALTFAKKENLKIIPSCSYVASWFEKHPEEESILQSSYGKNI